MEGARLDREASLLIGQGEHTNIVIQFLPLVAHCFKDSIGTRSPSI